MYLAKQNENTNLSIYVSLFKRLVNGTETTYVDEVKEVIIDAKHISEGSKDIFSARNDYFQLVSFLLSNGKGFLESLDENSIDNSTYQSIIDILNKESAFV